MFELDKRRNDVVECRYRNNNPNEKGNKMRTAFKLTWDNEIEILDLDAPEGSLKVLQEAVEGYIQPVDFSDTLTMYCNEEGKLEGFPTNEFGTRMFRRAFSTPDYIAGNIVFTGGVDEEGETMGLTEAQVTRLTFMVS